MFLNLLSNVLYVNPFHHQMVRFVWGCFNLPELCAKMGSSCYDRLWKKQTLKVWYSFVTKHFHQNMFIVLKTINIIWFQSFSQKNWQFFKNSILFFKLNIQHAFSAHRSGKWEFYHWWQQRKLLCLWWRWLRTEPLSECQSQIFEFFALFCHVENKHWEQFLVICRSCIWRRNQLFNIVKLCSERRGIS